MLKRALILAGAVTLAQFAGAALALTGAGAAPTPEQARRPIAGYVVLVYSDGDYQVGRMPKPMLEEFLEAGNTLKEAP